MFVFLFVMGKKFGIAKNEETEKKYHKYYSDLKKIFKYTNNEYDSKESIKSLDGKSEIGYGIRCFDGRSVISIRIDHKSKKLETIDVLIHHNEDFMNKAKHDIDEYCINNEEYLKTFIEDYSPKSSSI